jgi:hypothetical protein
MSLPPSQDIENYLRNNSSDSRIDKIQEVGKDLVDCGFLKAEIAEDITNMLVRRDQLHHQVRPVASRLILTASFCLPKTLEIVKKKSFLPIKFAC